MINQVWDPLGSEAGWAAKLIAFALQGEVNTDLSLQITLEFKKKKGGGTFKNKHTKKNQKPASSEG